MVNAWKLPVNKSMATEDLDIIYLIDVANRIEELGCLK
jgi:hypothetical protein